MKLFVLLSMLLIHFPASSQHVQVQGKLQVTDMPTENTDDLLVTRKDDGTLGTRQASSILPPLDTARTFERDIALAKQICDCPDLPPFLVQSALDNGYSVADLLAAGVPATSITDAGFFDDYIALFEAGISPILLVLQGAPVDLFDGLMYQDGLIFHIDTATLSGIVVFPEFVAQPIFGCDGLSIAGLQDAIGTGDANTTILLTCPDPATFPSCASFSQTDIGPGAFFESTYTDWYVPSSQELLKLVNTLKVSNPSLIGTGLPYYSSSVDYASTTSMCSTVLLTNVANDAAIVDNSRTSPQFRTVVVRTIN